MTVPATALDDGVIQLRMFDEADVDQLAAACQDVEIQRFIPIPRPYRRSDAEQYVARTQGQSATGEKPAFAIVDAGDPTRLLGAVNVAIVGSTGTAAYWIAPAARGRGVAGRALRMISDWAFATHGLGIILLEIHPANAASRAVARSAGYHRCGSLAVGDGAGPDAQTHLLYARLASDRPAATNANHADHETGTRRGPALR